MSSRHKTSASTSAKAGNPSEKSSQRVEETERPHRASSKLRERLFALLADTPSSLDLPPEPSNQGEGQAGNRQLKRRRDCEEEPLLPPDEACPAKRARTSISAVSYESQSLTAETLKSHTLREGYVDTFELMGSEVDTGSRGRGSKRSASRVMIGNSSGSSIGGDQETASQVTQKSSWTASHYRLRLLAGANIYFQFGSVPEDICSRIAAIVKNPVSKERKEELSRIKKTLHDDFVSVLSGAAREDDCVELFHRALSAMGHGDSVLLPRKADWEPSLKPRILAPMFDLGFLIPLEDEAEESLYRPSKRQQAEESYLSPDTSGAAATGNLIPKQDRGPGRMGPPPTPQLEVKTPRPDISIGLSNSAVVDALRSQGITGKQAEEFMKSLTMPDARNGGRPVLCSGPTKQEMHIRFPFLPVEGKSYATGRTIYEAQNQAAVSGACSLEILHRLDDLVRRASANPENHPKLQPIVFSVCTQGPIHELWAHYTTEEDNTRNYWQKLWNSCNVAVDCENSGFLEDVDNVMKWGAGGHLDMVANQIKRVWAAAQPFN